MEKEGITEPEKIYKIILNIEKMLFEQLEIMRGNKNIENSKQFVIKKGQKNR